jgi:hypothetical protein
VVKHIKFFAHQTQEGTNISKVTGFSNTIFKPSKVHKHIKIETRNSLALSIFCLESDKWAIEGRETRITVTKMKIIRRTAKYTWLGL